MTSANKTVEELQERLKKTQDRAAAIRKELRATEYAERAKRALAYWKEIHDIAIAKGVDIPTPAQVKKILAKSFLESAAAANQPPAKKTRVRAAAKKVPVPAAKPV